ncbi:peptide chain release factor 2 [Patescibacteria group bacterium]|nr:peptide chain release factor 2 [Patescibacteria group bacterium]
MGALRERLHRIQARLKQLGEKLVLPQKRRKLRELEAESMKPEFWKNEPQAKKVMQEIADIQNMLSTLERLEEKTQESLNLISLAKEEKEQEASIKKDLEEETERLEKDLAALELEIFLSGGHDRNDAILSIHAGQGGTEAMDWAAMLLRMYTRFAERRKWEWNMVGEKLGEEAGIKSATLLIKGQFAYGYLKREAGTHRLVRQSPFNADQLRQTSFALVEVLPTIKEPGEVKLRDEDIEFQAFRASGHGGQRVNKVSTAVRVKHIPTGITVECQTQRHQEQNRKIALQLLTARLWEKQKKKHEEEVKALKGEHKIAGWGNQIRSYVLHPYHLVKDLRTATETQDTDGVLDGQLEPFIDAQVRQLSG